jgi:hypothetical protein
MRHVILMCKNHPHLRWNTKEIAWSTRPDGTGYYNGCRNIRFAGVSAGQMYRDGSGLDCTWFDSLTGEYVHECDCPVSDLVLAFENKLVKE